MLASLLRNRTIPLVTRRQVVTTDHAEEISARLDFRSAMSQAVTGVNIVTTDGPGGRFGLTVSAVASVSAEPPMLLVCVNRKSVASNAIQANGSFAINVLAAGQQPVAETFSGSNAHGDAYTFNDEDWMTAVTKSPVLKGAVATFDCEIEAVMPAATHTIFVGRVQNTGSCSATPLLYTSRSYGRPRHLAGRRSLPSLITGTKTVLERFCARSQTDNLPIYEFWRTL
jgi:flavin reductase